MFLESGGLNTVKECFIRENPSQVVLWAVVGEGRSTLRSKRKVLNRQRDKPLRVEAGRMPLLFSPSKSSSTGTSMLKPLECQSCCPQKGPVHNERPAQTVPKSSFHLYFSHALNFLLGTPRDVAFYHIRGFASAISSAENSLPLQLLLTHLFIKLVSE